MTEEVELNPVSIGEGKNPKLIRVCPTLLYETNL